MDNTNENCTNLKCIDEGEDDNGSDDSEEAEPKLKYSRITNDLKTIFEKDAASCVAVHTKFLCVGTLWGSIYLLDFQGYSTMRMENSEENSPIRALLAHSVAVNQISIDARGDYIASCSDDGKVYIYGLYCTENHRELSLGRLVRSVCIDPYYYKSGSGRRFFTGDERLVLHEKTFLSRLKSTVVADASFEGGVKNIKWNQSGELVAWATHVGFRVYDTVTRVSLGLIKWNKQTQVDMKCHIVWKDKASLLVGWADTVRVCTILERPQSQFSSNLSPYILQPVFTFETEFVVCGVGPLEETKVVVLGFSAGGGAGSIRGERPHMHVIEPSSHEYIDLATNNLNLRGYDNYTPSNYSLECLVEESRYVIVSPKDIIIACPYDADDHLDWLLDHCKFQEALEAVMDKSSHKLRHTYLTVGKAYIEYLLCQADYETAGKVCHTIFGNDRRLWEAEIYKFAKVHQLRSVIDYLPMEEGNRLSPHVYDLVLYEYLKFDPEKFVTLVHEWPPSQYNVTSVGNAVVHSLRSCENKFKVRLIESLAILYSHEGKHEIALATYMKIRNKGIFELIKKQNLYHYALGILEDLMGLDAKQAVDTLMDYKDLDSDRIVQKFSQNKKYLFMYLDTLRERDSKKCEKHEHLLVELYADFDRDKLRKLLETSSHYPIPEALSICKHRAFHQETALLLEMMDNLKEALAVLTGELHNIEKAVDFCIKHDDVDLWQDLISYAKNDPSRVKYLLTRVGNYIHPIILVQEIGKKLVIPGLKGALVKMMQDYNLQVSFMEGCQEILVTDYFALQERLVTTRQRGTAISDEQYCGICMKKLFIKGSTNMRIISFHCNHVFHVTCLGADQSYCVICTPLLQSKKIFSAR